jgi:D-sedoheptulose 7-phosphate isomerase
MNKTAEQIDIYLKKVSKAIDALSRDEMTKFIELLHKTYLKGGNIYFFGNGGSAATASHICGDFVKGLSFGQERRFKAICFSDNSAALMAIANDISYDDIFVEQLINFLEKDDLVVGISGSGNSENVLRAISYANEKGVNTVGLCGFGGGKLKSLAKHAVHVDIDDMEITEDVHMAIGHCAKSVLMGTIFDIKK